MSTLTSGEQFAQVMSILREGRQDGIAHARP